MTVETWDLVADIGGTNMRFGAVRNGALADISILPTKHIDDISDALSTYISALGCRPRKAMLAAAGMIGGDTIYLTNAQKTLHVSQIRSAIGTNSLVFLNDFEAAAWAVAKINQTDVTTLQGHDDIPMGNRVVIGPGTGLGVGALLHTNAGFIPIAGEGGHIGISPSTAFEIEVYAALRGLWPDVFFGTTQRVEVEALLSGTGIPYLYRAVSQVLGQTADLQGAQSIFEAAKFATNIAATRTIEIFKSNLGSVAGDYGLMLSAQGGVFLAGGIAVKNPWLFDQAFLKAFNAGGRFTTTRKNLNLYAYESDNFGLIGAMNALELL